LQAVAMAQAGYGMLCQTVKSTTPSDVEFFIGIAKDAGRERSVVLVGPTHQIGFNILKYEMTASRLDGSPGDMAANVATLFSLAAELALPNRGKQGDHIWRLAVESLVRHAVTAVYSATGDLWLDDIVSVVKTAPQSSAQVTDPVWCRESACIKLLDRAAVRRPGDRNLELARSYFLFEFPGYPPDTRNSVMFTFGAGCADLFQREPLRNMFFADTDYTPSVILDGAILIVDCPVLEYREVGQIANGLLRICTQRVLERRPKHSGTRPVAIVWDECQKTLLQSDVDYQETARSCRCATVAASQHVTALWGAVGEDIADTFIGNLRTKVFFQNNQAKTGDFMRDLCAQRNTLRKSRNRDKDGNHSGTSEFQQLEDVLPVQASHDLRTGGNESGFKVTGLLVVGSKKLPQGDKFQEILINQKRLGRSWWPLSNRAQIIARRRPAPDFRYLQRRSV
jgi:hypothetical protein